MCFWSQPQELKSAVAKHSSCPILFSSVTLQFDAIVKLQLKHLRNSKHSNCSLDICCLQNKRISSMLAAFSMKYFVYPQSLRKNVLFNIYHHFSRKTSSFKTHILGNQSNCKFKFHNGKHFSPEVSWSGKILRKLHSCTAIQLMTGS